MRETRRRYAAAPARPASFGLSTDVTEETLERYEARERSAAARKSSWRSAGPPGGGSWARTASAHSVPHRRSASRSLPTRRPRGGVGLLAQSACEAGGLDELQLGMELRQELSCTLRDHASTAALEQYLDLFEGLLA